jgi:hypothetical protein
MYLIKSSYFLLVQILSFFAGRKILLGYESIGVDGTKKNHYLRIKPFAKSAIIPTGPVTGIDLG